MLEDGIEEDGYYGAPESLHTNAAGPMMPDCRGLEVTARKTAVGEEILPQIIERELLVEIYSEAARRWIRHHADDPPHPSNIGFRFRGSVLIPQFRKFQP